MSLAVYENSKCPTFENVVLVQNVISPMYCQGFQHQRRPWVIFKISSNSKILLFYGLYFLKMATNKPKLTCLMGKVFNLTFKKIC